MRSTYIRWSELDRVCRDNCVLLRVELLSSSLMSPDEGNLKTSWVCVRKKRECWSRFYFKIEYARSTKVARDVETRLFGRIRGKPFYYWSKSLFARCNLKSAAGMGTVPTPY
ncbi:hypothetical protein NPIL_365631 [Nephila pilipes]|uniref:Uncharacterized protein n=1 Tax=Nephila pilipes TaxID=299642 RepID=A0A8X6QJ48_NEPPI|nr:hypothetical protein NPIL_365631 [Nephila pilipes]